MNWNGRAPTTLETCPGPMKPSIASAGESSSARSGGTIVTWLHMQEKFAIPSAFARLRVSAVEGAVVSKPMAKNTTSRSGFCLAIVERVERRVDHPHIRPLGLRLQQAAARARDAQHVAETGEDHVRRVCDRDAVVDAAHRQHAHRTAGSMHELDRVGEQAVDPVAVDRMGVPSADLHQLVRASGLDQRADLAGEGATELCVAELLDEPHAGSRMMAVPACTSSVSPGTTAPTIPVSTVRSALPFVQAERQALGLFHDQHAHPRGHVPAGQAFDLALAGGGIDGRARLHDCGRRIRTATHCAQNGHGSLDRALFELAQLPVVLGAHLLEQLQRRKCLALVDLRERKAHVDQHPLAGQLIQVLDRRAGRC